MLKDIVAVDVLASYQLHLTFEDGVVGVVDVAQLVDFSGVFQPLSDPKYFATVQIHAELGTVIWSNGADLDPDVLYAQISGKPIPNYEVQIVS